MAKIVYLLVFLLMIAMQVVAGEHTPVVKKSFADSVYRNGYIYTVDTFMSVAEAVAIKDGKYIEVGSDKQVEAFRDR